MKKIALLLVVSLLICAVFCGCGGGGNDLASNIEGTWVMTSVSDGEGTEVSLEEYGEALGIDMSQLEISFTFEKDGVAKASAMGVSVEGTYEVSGDKVTVTMEGDAQDLSYDADKEALVLKDATTGETVYLTKK